MPILSHRTKFLQNSREANYFPGTAVVVPILAFSGISIPMNMLFALITGRTLRDPEPSARPVEA